MRRNVPNTRFLIKLQNFFQKTSKKLEQNKFTKTATKGDQNLQTKST